MADYYCQDSKGWGKGAAKHDTMNAKNPNKLNDNGEMVQLFMPKGRGRGLDGVWESNGTKPYAIIEAKCSDNPTKSLAALLGDAGDKNGADVEEGKKARRGRQNRGGGTQSTSPKTNSKGGAIDTGGERSRQVNGKVTQMSKNWIETRLKKGVRSQALADKIIGDGYTRHVLFFSIPEIDEHMQALALKAAGQPVADAMHAIHKITKEWKDSDIAKVVDNRAGLRYTDRDRRPKK